MESYFDGSLFQLIGWKILGGLVVLFTFGLGYPFALCMVYDWEIKHTVIEGKRLYFDGDGISLFANWIKWLFLILITFGIYGFFVSIAIKKWKVKHTHFVTN